MNIPQETRNKDQYDGVLKSVMGRASEMRMLQQHPSDSLFFSRFKFLNYVHVYKHLVPDRRICGSKHVSGF